MSRLQELKAELSRVNHSSQLGPVVGGILAELEEVESRLDAIEQLKPKAATKVTAK